MCVLTTQRMSVVISLHPHKHEYYDMAFLGFLWKQVLRQICSDEKNNQSFEKKIIIPVECWELKSVSVFLLKALQLHF